MGTVAGLAVSLAVGVVLAVVAAFTGATLIQDSASSTVSAPLVVYGSR